jgi:large subunit ribosomal protein L32
MPVPKRKTSKSRIRARKASHRVMVPTASACSNCGAPRLLHRVCPSCGFYRGKQVVPVDGD